LFYIHLFYIDLLVTKPLRSGDPPDRREVPQSRDCGLYQLSYSSEILSKIRLEAKPLRSGDPPDRRGVPQSRDCGLYLRQKTWRIRHALWRKLSYEASIIQIEAECRK